jgi:uncharacterized repeat protein (TIGR03803 family)
LASLRLLSAVVFVSGVFALQSAEAQTYRALYSFIGPPTDGGTPISGLTLDPTTGSLYGVTGSGGAEGVGTMYKVDTTGKESVVYYFMQNDGGESPYNVTLVRDSAGNFYGTASQIRGLQLRNGF